MNSIKENVKRNLHKKIHGLRQTTIEDCDVILFFCFIVSRAGTDINAALDELKSPLVFKPVILVVLHHTFDTEKMISDSNRTVNSEQIFAVDCLFNEDDGLLRCQKNEDAVDKIVKYLKSQKLNSYACFKDNSASLDQSTDLDESTPLIHSEVSSGLWPWRIYLLLIFFIILLIVTATVILLYFSLRKTLSFHTLSFI